MNKNKIGFFRNFIITAIFIFVMFIYGGTLLNMQIANADQYQFIPSEIAKTEKFIIPAVRGEIFDRNGEPLVTNRLIYDLTIDGAKFPRTRAFLAQTEYVINLVNLIELYGGELAPHTLPVISIDGGRAYTWSPALSESRNLRDNFYSFLKSNDIPAYISPGELVNRLSARYNLSELMPPEEREQDLFMTVLGVCYDLDRRRISENQTRYTVSFDISETLATALSENAHNYPGAEIIMGYKRVYHAPDSAPHLIGRIGQIPEGQLEKYTELGYPMNAIVGLNGVEAAFEQYLRGWDGVLYRHYDHDGNIIGEDYINPVTDEDTSPVPGKNVYLTLDIKMQRVAEYSLSKTISRIHGLAQLQQGSPGLEGADAKAGSAAVLNPNNGEILALATYPSYNLDTFNEDYAELRERSEDSPLMNRALQGLYAPGSVFKIATSVAALSSGHLTTGEYIHTRGKYTVYEDFQPVCWRYNPYGGVHECHGYIRVDRALSVSCNYFYYVVSERMAADRDIKVLNKYAQSLGLGVRTGIEVGEERGVVASRAQMEATGRTWFPGDTLQAAIGQSVYLFTPLQMAAMLSSVLTGGTRYETRLLLYVKEYGSDEIYYAPEPVAADSINIEPEHLTAIKAGMGDVFDADAGGTAGILFRDMPGLSTGGKTGTAQVGSTKSPNATIVAFAPFTNPELAMSVVIENGRHGTWAGFTAEDVFAYYFGYKTFAESLDMPDEAADGDEDINERENINGEDIHE